MSLEILYQPLNSVLKMSYKMEIQKKICLKCGHGSAFHYYIKGCCFDVTAFQWCGCKVRPEEIKVVLPSSIYERVSFEEKISDKEPIQKQKPTLIFDKEI